MRSKKSFRVVIVLIVIFNLFAACTPQTETPAPETATAAPAPTDTPTPVPPRVLTVCLGAEPNTLYLYGNPNAAALSVMQAIYDGPMDLVKYETQPVILTQRPSFANGAARFAMLQVKKGDLVVDAEGVLRPLDKGVRVHPTGCTADSCALTYDGTSLINMDQLVVAFTLIPNLTWSDGTPLTAADSVYSEQVAADAATPGSKFLFERTASYEAVDDQSVEWWGVPGFSDPDYANNFWQPLPRHTLEGILPGDLLTSPAAAQTPIGWGAYALSEWVPGEYIQLVKNPNYFRASEGLPHFDILKFRFVDDADQAISDIIAGQCDLVDSTAQLESQASLLLELQNKKQALAFFTETAVMERLDIGVRPASYENGYTPVLGNDRLDFFSDRRMRQALALCLDRAQVNQRVLFGLSSVPLSFVPVAHPVFSAQVQTYPFDPAAGGKLLDEVGWRDTDSDPATPRIAVTVANIPVETPLKLTYITTSALQRRQVSEVLAASLGQCGIAVEVKYMTPEELYAPGPAGLLFGRNFDLAEFAMASASPRPACQWFTSAQIPAEANNWIGTNVSGYSNLDFDKACQAATRLLPDNDAAVTGFVDAQAVFAQDLPSIPLYWRIKAAAGRPDLCGFQLDPSGPDLQHLELLNYGSTCQP